MQGKLICHLSVNLTTSAASPRPNDPSESLALTFLPSNDGASSSVDNYSVNNYSINNYSINNASVYTASVNNDSVSEHYSPSISPGSTSSEVTTPVMAIPTSGIPGTDTDVVANDSSGIVKPAITPVRDSGVENTFEPQQNTASSARPDDGLPVLRAFPSSRPFSFDQAFSSDFSTAPTTTATPAVTTQSRPPSARDAPNHTFGDAFGFNGAQTGSFTLGTVSSQTSSIPLTQSLVSTVPASNPVRGFTSPRETVGIPVSPQPYPVPPPPPLAPSKGRAQAFSLSSKESGKERETRPRSELSVSGNPRSPGVEKMTFVPITDPSSFWEEEEATGPIASCKFPTFESESR